MKLNVRMHCDDRDWRDWHRNLWRNRWLDWNGWLGQFIRSGFGRFVWKVFG